MMRYIASLCLMLMLFTLGGCEVIGDIFSAGFYTGIFIVVLVVAIIIWIIAKLRR